jgi:hypothetical protein
VNNILTKYNLSFSILESYGNKYLSIQQITDDVDFSLLNNFVCEVGFDLLEYDILPDINKALNNEEFDTDEWSTESDLYLSIGKSNCVFSNSNSPKTTFIMLTEDVKAIFEEWIKWVKINKFQKLIR